MTPEIAKIRIINKKQISIGAILIKPPFIVPN